MDSKINIIDKLIILSRTGIKFFRGGMSSIFETGKRHFSCWQACTDFSW